MDPFPARPRGRAATLRRHGGRRLTDTPAERGAESTWTSLGRRKVVQWGLVYVAGAWGFLQGLEYVTRTFHWPEHVQQVATLTLLIGLPIVLVLAWYHGDRGEQHVRGTELAIIATLFLLGGGVFWRYGRTTEQSNPAASSSGLSADSVESSAVTTRMRPSVAVGPFANLTADPANDYLAQGIDEALMTALGELGELNVVGPISSFIPGPERGCAYDRSKAQRRRVARRKCAARGRSHPRFCSAREHGRRHSNMGGHLR